MNTHTVQVISVKQETPHVKTIGMSFPQTEQGYTFTAGAFAMVGVPGSGIPARPFSFSSSPEDEALEITVEKTGRITTALHNVQVGDQLELSMPMGKFQLPQTIDKPFFFLVGGTGIAPVRSMLRVLKTRDELHRVTLCYSARNEDDIIFADELAALRVSGQGITVAVTLTRAKASSENWQIGRFTIERLQQIAPQLQESECFLCGSPDFVQHFIKQLNELGIERSRIRAEQWLQPGL